MPLVLTEEEKKSINSPNSRVNTIINTSVASPAANSGGRFGNLVPEKRETLDDLETDEEFQQNAEVFLSYLGTRDDIFETLRDSDYNIYGAVKRASEAGDWPEEVKQAYAHVRSRFDQAGTGSFNQYLEATKDIGIDVISDPTLIASLAAAPFTGGASVGARQVAAEGAKRGLARLTTAKLGMAEGAAWAGTDAWSREKVAEAVGLTDSVSGSNILAGTVVGGVAGGVMGKLLGTRVAKNTERHLSEDAVEETFNAYQRQGTILVGERAATRVTAKTVGKPSGVFSPFTKVSQTAQEEIAKFRYDMGRPLNKFWEKPTVRDVAEPDFHQTAAVKGGDYLTRIKKIIAPISTGQSGRLLPDINDELVRALRTGSSDDATINTAANRVRAVLNEMGKEQEELGIISGVLENYMPRKWNRKAIEQNQEDFMRRLMDTGEATDRLEARRIVEELLDKKNQLATTTGHFYAANRKFTNIADDTYFEKYLDNDFNEVMLEYVTQASKKAAAARVFTRVTPEGKTVPIKSSDEYNQYVIEKIADEAKAGGVTISRKERAAMLDAYKSAVGEVEYFEGKLGVAKDYTALGYQMALLPLATLSSVTEILIPLTRASTPTYMKGVVKGLGAGFKNITIDMMDMLNVKHGMTRPKVFQELNRFMIALDQAAADQVERLSGTELQSRVARKVQNGFFRANFLTQWTKMVQATSFIVGKDLIKDNLRQLSKMSDLQGRKAIRLRNELSDLGVDYQKGLEWYNAGANTAGNFYKNELERGAATFVEEIILNTSREAGTKPTLFSNPKTDILFQFMGYPAAFTNVVLKNMGKQVIENPVRGGAKVLTGALIMSEIARYGNWVRSGGRSEEEVEPWEARLNGMIRWGGNGLMLDMGKRAMDSVEATGTPMAAPAGFMGPIVSDAIQTFAYRKGPISFFGSKVPGYSAGYAVLGPEKMDDYNKWLRAKDRELMKSIQGEPKAKINPFGGGDE